MKTPMVRLNLACRCGAHWWGALPAPMAAAMDEAWKTEHPEGHPEHGACTPAEAGAARRAAERRVRQCAK